MRKTQENFKNMKYNPYAPLKKTADTYNEAAANEAINNLRGELTTRLKDSKGFVGKTIEELVEEKNILRQLEDMPKFTKYALKRELSNSLIRLKLLDASELHRTTGLSAVNFAAKGEEIIGKLQASKSFAQIEAKTTLQEFFTAHINQIQDGKTKINLVNLMDKLLFDIQEMKNASTNGSALMGEMLEIALDSKSPIQITAPGIKPFTLQQLSAFVTTNQQLKSINIPMEKQTDDMVRLIESLVSKNADLSVPTTRKFNG